MVLQWSRSLSENGCAAGPREARKIVNPKPETLNLNRYVTTNWKTLLGGSCVVISKVLIAPLRVLVTLFRV